MGFSLVEFLGDLFDEAQVENFKDKSILILGYQKNIHSQPIIYSYAKGLGIDFDYSMLKNHSIMGADVK